MNFIKKHLIMFTCIAMTSSIFVCSNYPSGHKALAMISIAKNADQTYKIGTISLTTRLYNLNCSVIDKTSTYNQDVDAKIEVAKQLFKHTLKYSDSFNQGLQEGQRDIVVIIADPEYASYIGFRESIAHK